MTPATLSASLLWLTACVVSAEIFRNAGFESPLGPENWSCSGCTGLRDGDDKVEGTYSMLVSERVADWAGPSQVLEWGSAVKDGRSYAFRIFVKLLDGGTTPYQVKATMNMKMKDGSEVHLMMFSTNMTAQDGWRRMYGDITVPDTYGGSVSRVWMHVAGAPAAVRFLVDGASLEELPRRESWRAEADARIEQIRKRDVILRVNTDSPESIEVEVAQTKSHFAFGSAVNAKALETSGHYRDFFFNNFEWAVIENGLKWQQTDPYPFVFHSWPDTVIKMLESQGVPIRGHCIFWAKPEHVPKWLGWIDWLWDGVVTHMCRQRVDDVVGRYAGRLAHWDVNNEMLHASYFMDRTGGPQIRYDMFRWAQEKDPNVKLFLNDYNVISSSQATQAYADQISEFLGNGAPVGGVGVQGHFKSLPDPVLIKSRLDLLASSGLPIWVTELDFSEPDEFEKADGYEDAMRAAFSHPAVEGLLIWGFWDQAHWRPDAALVNGENFQLNEAGHRWQRLVFHDWRTNLSLTDGIVTPEGKEFIFRGFHGNYEVKVKNHGQVVATKTFYLRPEEGSLVVDIDITDES